MKPNSTNRKQPQLGQAVQLPEGGFEHPFQYSRHGFEYLFQDTEYGFERSSQDSQHREGPHRGKERLRTVGGGSSSAAVSLDVASSDRRAADVCALSSH